MYSSSSQFLSDGDLREKAALHIPNFVEVEDDFIFFPHLNITQDGYLVKWIFTAEDLGQGEGRTQYPQLRIVRSDFVPQPLQGSDPVPTDYSNVYEFTLASPMQVQAGYMIALQLPPITSARLLLSFVRNSGPPGESVRVKRDIQPVEGREGDLPLVTLEISKSRNICVYIHLTTFMHVTGLATSSTPTVVPTPSTHPTLSQPPTSSSCLPPDEADSMCGSGRLGGGRRLEDVTLYIITGTVSSLVLLIIATAAAISLLLWLRKRKRDLRKRKSEPELANNVAYHSYDIEIEADDTTGYHTVTDNTVTTHSHTAPKARESMDTKNEAHTDINISTFVNPAYNQVENSDDDNSECLYDYVRTANMHNVP